MTVIILFINHLSLIIETKMSSALCVLQRSDFHFLFKPAWELFFLMPIIFATCDSFVSLQKKIMADGYIEKKMEDFKSNSRKVNVKHHSLDALMEKNRSYRGYDKNYVVKKEMLERIVNVNTKIASAKNQQVLRFRLVTKGEDADFILENIKLGGMLPELHLPFPGTEPESFIIVCSTVPETKFVDIDLGISLQSMSLKATEMGLNGIVICAFNKAKITEHFDLPFEPLAILAIGKGSEEIKLVKTGKDASRAYYREDGVHYVPKVILQDIMI